MNKNTLAVVLAALLSTSVHAKSEHVAQSGEALVKMCNGAERVKMLGMMCHSYLNGYLDTAEFLGKGSYCLGNGDKQRLPAVVITWINAHPEFLKRPAPDALGRLLPESYPCRK